ncbi:MAG TPA: hypothetical protein VFD94_02630, partial [Jatrophihabitans sp.]|nr:hypothetical protein [Jatrophihabitans sp.]
GALLSQHPTGSARPDINRDNGAAGDHGFDLELAAAPGLHSYTVYAAGRSRAGSSSATGSSATGAARVGAASLIGGGTVISEELPAEAGVLR